MYYARQVTISVYILYGHIYHRFATLVYRPPSPLFPSRSIPLQHNTHCCIIMFSCSASRGGDIVIGHRIVFRDNFGLQSQLPTL